MALAAARDVGIDVRPGVGLSIVGLAKERDSLEGGGIEPEPLDAAAAPTEPAPVEAAAPAEPAPVEAAAPPEEPGASRGAGARGAAEEAGPQTEADQGRGDEDAGPRVPRAREGRDPHPPEQRRDVHPAAPARRGAPLRRDVPPQPAQRLTLRSALAEIPGIGETRQRALLRHFGSVKKIREASLEDLCGVPGMTRAAATAVFEHWKRQPAPPEDPALTAHVARESGPPSDEAEEDATDSAFAELEADVDIDEGPDAPEPT